jgi:hypothetical protein
MGTRAAYQRVIIHACIACGDEAAFAEAIGTPVSEVVDWLLGERPVPPHYYLKAVDIVLASNRKQVSDNRRFLEQVRSRHAAHRRR